LTLNNQGKDIILKYSSHHKERVTTALLLAAGTGSRLYPLTRNEPKCLTIVNGVSILERMISNLNLWMAREVINEPFLLLESDLVFDESLLDAMLYPDRIAVAKMRSWMNGTSVTINQSKQVKAFLASDADSSGEIKYKTVNIYSISLNSWHEIVKRLDKHISDGKVNDYYEAVFAEMIADGSLSFKAVSFDGKPWYEIDTVEDLAEAEKLFFADDYTTTKTVSLSHPDFLLNAVPSPWETTGIFNAAK